VARVFLYLTKGESRRWLSPFGVFIGTVAATTYLLRRQPVVASVVLIAIVFLHDQMRAKVQLADVPGLRLIEKGYRSTVLVDANHHSTYDPFGGTPKGIAGLDTAFLRRGQQVLDWTRPIAGLPPVTYFLLLSPIATVSRTEVIELERFMRDGGIVFVAGGFDNQHALRYLFQKFGISISYTPLGSFRAPSSLPGANEASFRSAWPLIAQDNYESLCRVWARDILVRKRIGKGSLVVLSDGEFFVESNLEGPRTPTQAHNVKFVQALFDYLESS
jgi:hypothetical protein